MFGSLKIKIIGVFTIIMVVTAGTIMYFTHRDVGKAMLEAEKASAENVSRFIQLNLGSEYQQLLLFKVDTIRQRRKQLKALSSLTAAGFSVYASQLNRPPDKKLKHNVLRWMQSIPSGGEVYWFIFDQEATIVSSSNQAIEGTSIASLLDLKGQPFAGSMRYDVLSAEGEFSVFNWDREHRGVKSTILGHFVPLAEWGWTYCAAIDISDIEAVIQEKTEKVLKVLGENFAEMKLGQTGYSFLFNGAGDILIPPKDGQGGNLEKALNVQTGKPLLQEFMDRAKGDGRIRYISSATPGKEMEALVSHFKSLNWYTVITVPTEEINRPARVLVTGQSLIIAIIFLVSLAVTYMLVARISKPLQGLADYAKELPSQDLTAEIREGEDELLQNLTRRGNDEVKRLAESFIFMKAELKKNILSLIDTTAAKERMQSELNVAHDIQMGFLPKIFPPFPDRKEFDLHATLKPAKEVGGDLYDYFFIDDRRLCFTLGDVSDKGVPAALFMGITKTLIKVVAHQNLPASGIMSLVNKVIQADNPSLMFVTLVVGILDTHTGQVNYANGGHNPPIVIRYNGEAVFKKEISGPVVGAMGDIDYKDLNFTLEAGDALLLYTDGVTEAMNEKKQLYSDEQILSVSNSIGTGEVKEVIDGIMKTIADHVGSAPPSDDIAMLMIRYRGLSEQGLTES